MQGTRYASWAIRSGALPLALLVFCCGACASDAPFVLADSGGDVGSGGSGHRGGVAGADAGGVAGADVGGVAGANVGGVAGAVGGETAGPGGTGSGGGAAGTNGTGGKPGFEPTPACAMHPIPAKSSWTLRASYEIPDMPPSLVKDDALDTRWSTAKPQSGDESLKIEFNQEVQLTSLTMLQGQWDHDYPVKYQARVLPCTGGVPTTVSGEGVALADTIVSFAKGTCARGVVISQVGSSDKWWWSVAEVEAECVD